MKVVTVVGARPQFVKAALVSRRLAQVRGVEERLVHTGQHYDEQMSQVFFDQLEIPAPAHWLNVGSGPHGQQTGRMLERIESVLVAERPDWVLVYGDTNSTLAGALAAAKLHIPVAHVEAGLRSYNRRMPEETNRVLTDHVATLRLCPTTTAVANLKAEGVSDGVSLVGDVMFDCARHFLSRAASKVDPLRMLGLEPKQFVLMTCHRAENADSRTRLGAILEAAGRIAASIPVIFPVHPRTRKSIAAVAYHADSRIQLTEPLSYLETLILEQQAAVVLTDSGGVQKEAFILGTPCVTMRSETEWTETLQDGANILADADCEKIVAAVHQQWNRTEAMPEAASHYGGGRASERICDRLLARAA
jgi:UDP-GlcNAc3NAcA epimerase